MTKVMVVDDVDFMRMLLKDIITEMGYEIAGEASNGTEAVQMYSIIKPDVVTMDITMPEMDGITAMQEIKKLDPDAKFLFCSAMGQHKVVMDAISAGANDFIVKPVNKDKVVTAMHNIISH